MSRGPSIYYLTPDHDVPSWGTGLLYHHVRLLRERGFDAWVLHRRRPFRLTWLDVDVPIRYLDNASVRPRPEDLLVVPEVLAHAPEALSASCRRVVFVQGVFLVTAGTERAVDYRQLGYEAAMVILPHGQDIVARHFGIEPALVPPFVAPYFFADEQTLRGPRANQVLIAGKPEYRKAGYLDYDIVLKLLARHLEHRDRAGTRTRWRLIALTGRSHEETAELMQQSAILVNLNTLEGFNTTVPEAMAAGCLAVCYEAFGGRDYLAYRENAFVFPNNDVFALVEELLSLIDDYEARREELATVRARARATAERYREGRTSDALASFFESLR